MKDHSSAAADFPGAAAAVNANMKTARRYIRGGPSHLRRVETVGCWLSCKRREQRPSRNVTLRLRRPDRRRVPSEAIMSAENAKGSGGSLFHFSDRGDESLSVLPKLADRGIGSADFLDRLVVGADDALFAFGEGLEGGAVQSRNRRADRNDRFVDQR